MAVWPSNEALTKRHATPGHVLRLEYDRWFLLQFCQEQRPSQPTQTTPPASEPGRMGGKRQKYDRIKSRMAKQAVEEFRKIHGPFTLSEAADQLGVSVSSARRLLIDDSDVRRFSCRNGKAFFPGMALKRFERIRLTWRIPAVSIERARQKMRGQPPNVG